MHVQISFLIFTLNLGQTHTIPHGRTPFAAIDSGMFHASTSEKNKETVLKSLTDPNSVIRIVFATVALGQPERSKHYHTLWCTTLDR